MVECEVVVDGENSCGVEPGCRVGSPGWALLVEAITGQRRVAASYHGHERLLCPHVLGWRDGRAKLLAYQVGGETSAGRLAALEGERWRSMFVDEIEGPLVVVGPWRTARNYRPAPEAVGMDCTELAVPVGRAA